MSHIGFESLLNADIQKRNEKTLRDEFAMAALNSILSDRLKNYLQDYENDIETECYKIADAMLEARKAKGE